MMSVEGSSLRRYNFFQIIGDMWICENYLSLLLLLLNYYVFIYLFIFI